ncbi:MAG: DNA repair protein RadC [Nitrospirota bacterium]|nr:DNA repair protein RadC [Nitrospirota bacterium]
MANQQSEPERPLHDGHRDRLRQRARLEGLDAFADHEVLELLLFSVLPRVNTNPVAHRLMYRFGSLSAVLEADARDLATVDGIGARGADFLALVPGLARRYLQDRVQRDNPPLTDPAAVARYLVPLMAGRPEEVVYLLCLDVQCRVAFPALLSSGTVAEAYVHTRHAVEEALRHRATSAILAHNHPSGSPNPSASDIELTRRVARALEAVDIPLLDHVIVAGETTFSFEQEGMLPT